MEAIVINRLLSDNEEKDILILLQHQDIDLFANVEISEQLLKFSKGKFEISPEKKKELNKKTFKHIINFGERKINGVPLADLLTIENISIWHYHKFRSYFFLANLFYEIGALENLATRYDKISCYTNSSFLRDYFKSTKIKFFPTVNHRRKINIVAILNYAFFFFYRVLVAAALLSKIKKRKHIIIDQAIKQNILNINSLKPETGNYSLQYLFEEMDDDFFILDEVAIPKFLQGGSFKLHSYYFKIKKNRFNSEYILFRGFFSGKIKKKVRNRLVDLSNKYDIVKSGLTDPVDMLIINLMISLQPLSKFFLFRHFAFDHFFKSHSFQTISAADEYSPRIKSTLDAAKMNNLSTFGIQHGIIHDLQPNYHFTTEDKMRNITTDCTLIWGKYWEEKLLNQGNYPENSLKITGSIRTDIIPKLKRVEDKKLFNLEEEEQMIVFASQPIKDADMRRHIAFEVFSSVKHIPNCKLVVKLHPAEMNDSDYYMHIANEAGCANVIINTTIDLYLMISKADIIITSFSTVGLESVFFNKPLITIDPLKQDIQSYYKDKIAFQASNSEELADLIQRILNNSLTFDQEVYSNYIENQVYKIDGNVSKRCIEIIKSFNNPN